MNVLIWHVHAAWMTAFVQGGHTYLVPATPDRGPYGRGRADTYWWPDNVLEVTPDELAGWDVDVVVLQRPAEWELASWWLRRRLGTDLPVVYVEHNTPRADVPDTRHPMADRDDVTVVHVTDFNELFWDTGRAPTTVIEHGIPEPLAHYSGELPRLAIASNEPVRRWRVTGTDLYGRFAAVAPLDVYGMGVSGLADRTGLCGHELVVHEDPPQGAMHAGLSRRRAYLHLNRWTSLGLSLLEAMAMGMPVVALATTGAVSAVAPGAGVVDTRVGALVEAAHWLISDPDAARAMGARARRTVLRRYALPRFLTDWDLLLKGVVR